jgi:hypothetical protein
MYHLFLDDVRVPKQVTWVDLPLVEWTIVRSYDEFIQTIKQRGLPATVSFDHDLGYEHYPTGPQTGQEVINYSKFNEKTGYHCAQWMCEYCCENGLELPKCYVHSFNLVGKRNIEQTLSSYQTA